MRTWACLFMLMAQLTGCGGQTRMTPMISYEKGLKAMKEGDPVAALEHFDAAIALVPDDPYFQYDRAVALEKLGRTEAAIEGYSKCLEADEDFSRAWTNRGVLYAYQGKLDEAIRDSTAGIEADAADYLAYRNRGACYRQQGRLEDALNDLNVAVGLEREHAEEKSPESNLIRGEVLLAMQQYEESLQDAEAALQIADRIPDPHLLKGLCLRALGRNEESELCFADARRIEPSIEIPELETVVAAKAVDLEAQRLSSVKAQLERAGYTEIEDSTQSAFTFTARKAGAEVFVMIKSLSGNEARIQLSSDEFDAIHGRNVTLALVSENDVQETQVELKEAWAPRLDQMRPLSFEYRLPKTQ